MGSRISTSIRQRRAPSGSGPKRGFALILTLTLLAFVVLLLVGLATYTRVETSIAGNMQQQAQARENALLALNVALGKLQEHAGPDTRVTATAEHFAGTDAQKRHYTGVWPSDPAATTTPLAPFVWLASGVAEPGNGVDKITARIESTAPQVIMVGAKSDGSTAANATVVELQDIRVPGVPGQTGSGTPIGRYAWWVGDQGVKAPVAVPDNTDAIAFAPYDSAELRSRVRQQLAIGAGAADATSGEPVFEPRDSNNAPLVANQKIVATNQLAFVRSGSNAQLGLGTLQRYFHTWSPNNFSVLADSRRGGLRQDLSLEPTLLGSAFAAWANPAGYMEKFKPDPVPEPAAGEAAPAPAPTIGPTILPAYSEDPIRRRYIMTPHLFDANGSHQVAPVLTYFLLSFNVRAQPTAGGSPASTPQPLEVRARWMVSLWNPYTSSLVPENLRVEISRLPRVVEIINDSPTNAGTVGTFSLSSPTSPFGSPFKISLPWDSTNLPTDVPVEDRMSWLPGRVYTWRSEELSKSDNAPAGGFASEFYSRELSNGGAGVVRSLNFPDVDGDDECHLKITGSDTLLVTLYVVRPDGDVPLATFTSAQFVDAFDTTPKPIGEFGYQFSYVFRLAESIDSSNTLGAWLTAPGRDPRRRGLQAEAFVVESDGNNPAAYPNYSTISKPDRLLDRASNAWSYNEDTPIFELPRSPILSLGALQHFRMIGQRPFMIGNSWGVNAELNNIRLGELFDRFYFSGLVEGVVPATTAAGDLVLPNPLLKPLRKPDLTKVTIDDVRALMNPPATTTTDADGNVVTIPGGPASSYSSKFFLQGGAFNLNSTNPAAWAAVLRGVRFPTDASAFRYLDADPLTGTAADDAVATSPPSGNAQFFRFSQSAQETYKAEPGQAETGGDPAAPSPANTHLFRRGMRTLTAPQVAALAGKIADFVKTKHASTDAALGGPFRSLEEFLSPSTLFAGVDADGNPLAPRSVLEAAIADANINVDENGLPIEFSSQFLTQADIMTALAPILFPRSDTFVIRTHGQSLNPATGAVEGRAWCEAIVQRVPEYFDPSIPAETAPAEFDDEATEAEKLNKLYGRRFKVVSFRWLTRSDI